MKLARFRIVILSLSTLLLPYCMACGRQVLSKTNATFEKACATISQTGSDVAHIVADAKHINEEHAKHCQQQAIHTGDLAESLATEESFYNLRGGFDYDRLPLTWPVHLVRVAKTIDLVRETTIILNDVQEIGKEGDWLFGTVVANSSNAWMKSDAPFFHIPLPIIMHRFLPLATIGYHFFRKRILQHHLFIRVKI